MRSLALALLCASLLAACDYPRDAEGTLDRAKAEGVLRVGASAREPWVVASGSEITGVEPTLVAGFADSLGVSIDWVRGSESELVEALADRRIAVMVGGLKTDSPWIAEAAATQPYRGDHIMLVPAGENALLLSLDRFLARAAPGASR